MEGQAEMNPDMMQKQIEQAQAQQEQQAQMEEAKNSMMKQILSTEARERLSNIQAANPKRAEQIESIIIGNARNGTIQGKVSDAQLIDLIDQFDTKKSQETTVTFKRKNLIDSDEEEDLDEMFS
ncbi:unnamed protein product [Moneuplotes crassus]|uniref:Programmed cell death protein 5 n=1 Tax=Euplotes crassus TaxID=5936 RepID=A0AAD2D2P7_EUPCR|nr:unnamed protein product [Moneuplotes crassus]